MTPKKTKKRADQYNDPNHDYFQYWQGREYEHEAEELAIRTLLKDKHFRSGADIGGGFGRLCLLLEEYTDHVTLAEPSKQQLAIAKDFLRDHPKIDRKLMQADALDFKKGELDLITMIRVIHHIPDPAIEFRELARVLSPDGYLILEVANYGHAINRIKHILRGRPLPLDPVDIRSKENQHIGEIAFVNHNPKTIIKQLAHAGLKVERTLSVSNLRSPKVKKIVPRPLMLLAEQLMQPALAKMYFGPSTFLLVKKAK
ncbi:MAG: hypothetical protein JWL85_80 [Candidatus Saccharibacteria bacterium]|nr:hypothetical protein [Candidatus Saccharibacteria bacterium]